MMNQTILIVDDDEVLAQVLSRVLTRQGFTVCHASTAAQARRRVRDCNPGLALLDLCLPDGDGLELARDLRTDSPELPLILMTAFPLRLRYDPVGAEIFERVLTKPLNLKELREAVDSAITARPASVIK
jgi:DNA-binding response OmpR family regulator